MHRNPMQSDELNLIRSRIQIHIISIFHNFTTHCIHYIEVRVRVTYHASRVTIVTCHVSRVDHDVLAAGDASVEAAGPRPRQLRGPGPDVCDVVQLRPGQRLDTIYWLLF